MRFSEAMDGLIQVRVAREEKRRLIEAAHKRGETLSELFIAYTVEDVGDLMSAAAADALGRH
jgi:hypothetical protein